MAVLIFFVALQIADGLFTYHGVNAIGIDRYEANPILAYYMHRFGAAETLLVAKVVAASLGYVLYRERVFVILWLLVGFYLNNLYNQIMSLIHYSG